MISSKELVQCPIMIIIEGLIFRKYRKVRHRVKDKERERRETRDRWTKEARNISLPK